MEYNKIVSNTEQQPVVSRAIQLIAAERQRQCSEEGWSTEHDDLHSRGELAKAAEAYLNAMEAVPHEDHNGFCTGVELKPRTKWAPNPWPWDHAWWKPSDDPIRNLVKAGALIAAEIDRLIRTAKQKV